MGKSAINQHNAKVGVPAGLISWADWWEQWGDEVFDAPAAQVDLELVSADTERSTRSMVQLPHAAFFPWSDALPY